MRQTTRAEMQERGLLFQYNDPYITNGYIVDGVIVAEGVFHPNENEFPVPFSRGRCNFNAVLGAMEVSVGDECQAIINQSSAWLIKKKMKAL